MIDVNSTYPVAGVRRVPESLLRAIERNRLARRTRTRKAIRAARKK